MTKSKAVRWLLEALLVEQDECLLWPYSMQSNGYGDFNTKDTGHLLAHVYICQEAHGPRPGRDDAAHSCGTRLCCNKRHLSWKSRWANLEDRREHGTMTEGESHASVILTAEQVKYVRAMVAPPGASWAELARSLGVHPNTLYAIREGRSWKCLL